MFLAQGSGSRPAGGTRPWNGVCWPVSIAGSSDLSPTHMMHTHIKRETIYIYIYYTCVNCAVTGKRQAYIHVHVYLEHLDVWRVG